MKNISSNSKENNFIVVFLQNRNKAFLIHLWKIRAYHKLLLEDWSNHAPQPSSSLICSPRRRVLEQCLWYRISGNWISFSINIRHKIVRELPRVYCITFDWFVRYRFCMTPFVTDEKGNFYSIIEHNQYNIEKRKNFF